MSDFSKDPSKAGEPSLSQSGSLVRTRTEPDVAPEPEPASKKQKIQPSQSFADKLANWEDARFQQIKIEEVDDSSTGALRMYGVTEEGHSVLAHVSGFLPYFYIAVPRGFDKVDFDAFAEYLNDLVKQRCVSKVEQVSKRTLWGYLGEDWIPFLKITFFGPKHLAQIRDRFKDLFRALQPVATFESNVPYPLRFMADTKMAGMSWVEIPATKYTIRKEDDNTKISTCQIELDVSYDSLISHPIAIEGRWSKIAPLRILSFDIECLVRGTTFPEHERDAVIQIANVVSYHGQRQPIIRNVFTLNDCLPIKGAQVISFAHESEMLQAWRDFLAAVDPDIVMGFNIARFDLRYLLDRAQRLGITGFPFFGRLQGRPTQIRMTPFTSRPREISFRAAVLQGRIQFDVLQFMQREFHLEHYTLEFVSNKFLDQNKEDVHFSQITRLQNGTAETRQRLAVYCLKDAYLPLKLAQELMAVDNYIAMARVAGVPFSYLFSRGQSVRIFSQILRRAGEEGYLLPALGREDSDTPYEHCYDKPEPAIEAHTAMLVQHNLCYITLLKQPTIERLELAEGVDYIQTRNGDFFVKPERRKGIIPMLLEDLISAREQVDADLQTGTADSARRVMLQARQRALGYQSTNDAGPAVRLLRQAGEAEGHHSCAFGRSDLGGEVDADLQAETADSARLQARQRALGCIIAKTFYVYTRSTNGKLPCAAIARSAESFCGQDSEAEAGE
ncbi:ribonuclease H-like domain-containing protein [Hygrophoropsis aurantiaca]|uniref:Ribonuclease H-like domain-containing protein n=1 Tax=Hygrophoropsis aurantiaca TaxID=72124 RepID=A0ACB7ZWA4_9AGAM|nr:ribonuclease H-like domain-containing protein [Hygrophoropsis aurantiaca]